MAKTQRTKSCLWVRWARLCMGLRWAACLLLFAASCGQTGAADGKGSEDTAAEEQVTFYPTYGYQENDEWIIPLRIWVHEEPDLKRRGLATLARSVIARRAGLDELTEAEAGLFSRHSSGFFADSESRELVRFSFDNDPAQHVFFLADGEAPIKTDLNGLVEGTLKLDPETSATLIRAQGASQGWLRFRAVSEDHAGIGWVRLIPPIGHSVISDIDDTVKITGIPNGETTVLRNTFFRDLVAAPCMAELYQHFGDDTAFHYVSGGPWQMYEPLDRFLVSEAGGFPRGSFHMKSLRTNPFEKETYKDIWTLIANGSQQATFEQKLSQIRTIIEHFPARTFTLIGDSGESDPEVYKQVREEFPNQVREIKIRVVSDSDAPDRLEGMTRIPATIDAGESCRNLLTSGPE